MRKLLQRDVAPGRRGVAELTSCVRRRRTTWAPPTPDRLDAGFGQNRRVHRRGAWHRGRDATFANRWATMSPLLPGSNSGPMTALRRSQESLVGGVTDPLGDLLPVGQLAASDDPFALTAASDLVDDREQRRHVLDG